eukprot:SAG11_NODE_2335_length_3504_cov_2.100734_2_plen_81_part_00
MVDAASPGNPARHTSLCSPVLLFLLVVLLVLVLLVLVLVLLLYVLISWFVLALLNHPHSFSCLLLQLCSIVEEKYQLLER